MSLFIDLPRLFLFLTPSAFAIEYQLTAEMKCFYSQGEFSCKDSKELPTTIREKPDGQWVGILVWLSGRISELTLRVVKNDDNMLVLNDPAIDSGNMSIYMMKKTGRFYRSALSYGELIAGDEEGYLEIGTFSLDRSDRVARLFF